MRSKVKKEKLPVPPNRIKELRERAGLTQTKLGAEIGVSHASVSRWENAEDPVSSSYVMIFAEVFGCHMVEIFSPLPAEPAMPTAKHGRLRDGEDPDREALDAVAHIVSLLPSLSPQALNLVAQVASLFTTRRA